MSDTDTTSSGSRKEQAKALLGEAGETIKAEAQSFAHVAQDRAKSEAQKGVQTAGKTLGDFANAVRRAGDDLAGSDHSPASRLVGQAADGLESLSRNLADKNPGDILNAVRDFGRKNPWAFIGGAVLAGVALGRFARASEPEAMPRLSDERMTFADDDAFDEPAETYMGAGISSSIDDNLGDLTPSTESETTTSLGMGDGTSGIGDPDGSTGQGR